MTRATPGRPPPPGCRSVGAPPRGSPQLRAAFDGDRPDLILSDIASYSARVLAHRWDRPLVQLSPTYVAWEANESDMAETVAGRRADPAGAAYYVRFAEWLDAEGVPLDADTVTGRPAAALARAGAAGDAAARRPVDERRYTFVVEIEQRGWGRGGGQGREVRLGCRACRPWAPAGGGR